MKKFWKDFSENKKQEIIGILWFVITILIVISLFPHAPDKNLLGAIGKYFEKFVVWLTGCACIFIPFITGYYAFLKVKNEKVNNPYLKLTGTFLLYMSILILFDLLKEYYFSGGIVGEVFSNALQKVIGRAGAYVLVITGIVLSLYLLEIEYILRDLWKKSNELSDKLSNQIMLKVKSLFSNKKKLPDTMPQIPTRDIPEIIPIQEIKPIEKKTKVPFSGKTIIEKILKPEKIKDDIIKEEPRPKGIPSQREAFGSGKEEGTEKVLLHQKEYNLPLTQLLSTYKQEAIKEDTKEVGRLLEITLKNFGIDATVIGITPGPVITRYELQPSPGTKISRIVSLSNDIALSLKATNVRVEAPIPGKGAVGIEIPNRQWRMVGIKDLLETPEWDKYKASSKLLTVALGKSIDGVPIIEDLALMPHLLIAGATGSGKSICIASVIISLLYRATPAELKLFLIDPKRVELSMMGGLPHLYAPIINDAKLASEALKRLIKEMEERYKRLAARNSRDIRTYNSKLAPDEERMPYIVVVVDELADLMLVAARDVEESITRLAQLARGVGIHLVLATQRPSVDVITGVIKANLPTRIAFQVASKVDSRTILDMNGAEELIGRGDMLFFPSNIPKPIRAQGSYVSTEEIERVVEFWKNQGIPQYEEKILSKMTKPTDDLSDEDRELLRKALELIKERKRASAQLFKGALRVGDGKAIDLISKLETKGLIGYGQGSKPREIYYDRIEEFLNSLN
jgi:S-DNA-T family DNA segregation ATPase FtsK/SpoIIIE